MKRKTKTPPQPKSDLLILTEVLANNTKVLTSLTASIQELQRDVMAIMDKQVQIQTEHAVEVKEAGQLTYNEAKNALTLAQAMSDTLEGQ